MPDKRFWVGVGGGQVFLEGVDQFRDALKASPPHPLFRQFPEPPLHQIQPRRTGGCEVQDSPRVFLQPLLYLRLLMGSVVVHDQVQQGAASKLPVTRRRKRRNS